MLFRQLAPQSPLQIGLLLLYTYHLLDVLSLRAFYSDADAMVIACRLVNLPNTGVETCSCGYPVVAFITGGLPTSWMTVPPETLPNRSIHICSLHQFA